MFIELVDALRCRNSHEESWLVASATRMEARHIVRGTLGCPVCLAEYPIEAGVVDFRRDRIVLTLATTSRPAESAMNVAAMLNLADASGFAVLLGAWGSMADELTTVAETPLILVNPAADVMGAPGISVLRCDAEIPIASGAARGVAVDDENRGRVTDAVRVTKAKGRVLAPVGAPITDGVRELARNDTWWVAEREAVASPIVTLHVRRAQT